MNLLFRLFYEFFLIGLFSIGGGMATVPFLQELAVRSGWYSLAELSDMIAIAESTPGPIGINMATYVGFKTAGLFGGVTAVLGIVTPSIVMIVLIARVLQKFRENRNVDLAFSGLRPASAALIAAAGAGLARPLLFGGSVDWKALILLAVLMLPMLKTKLHPLIFIAFSAVVGILFKF